MSLKQPHKLRIDLNQIQHGEMDDDGYAKILYRGDFYTGYLVLDKFPNEAVQNEIEYKNGSHLGWDNEYNENGQLIRTSLSVGETTLCFYEYDSDNKIINGGKLTDDEYYQKMVKRYGLD
ncbi:hypothetical protein [Flavobacterium tyrosinilyticum]|uniref:hypothetical protein n=1 Tax=Flavobacterium tyrosinilyticum TaxID=1658740 RepID=UPI00202FA06F|nr:hypothetical protein [Flavobacterium tyrosinilyticum]MCM0666051.1 hypothetical protein [Flavobacterium tyrosinilyticum]